MQHEVILAAVGGKCVGIRSEELKSDREVVMASVTYEKDPYQAKEWNTRSVLSSLAYASDQLKNDKEIVLTAVKNNAFALRHASDELKNDKDVVLVSVSKQRKNNFIVCFKFEDPRNDKCILENSMFYASDELKDSKDVVLAAVS